MSRLRRQRQAEIMAKPHKSRTKEVAVGLGLDCILAISPAITTMPVRVRWGIWWFCFTAFVFLIQMLIPPIAKISWKWRTLATLVLSLIFAICCRPIENTQWREERAAALNGHIAARDHQFLSYPRLQFGDSGPIYAWHPEDEPLKVLHDASLSLQLGKDGIEISTTMRDKSGRRIAWIDNNTWHVEPPPASVDKNYTDDTLEVEDGGGHVVLQVRLLPDRIQLRGEWHDEYGNGSQISECPQENPAGGCLQKFGSNWPEEQHKVLVKPMFLYPSKDHWGEFAKRP